MEASVTLFVYGSLMSGLRHHDQLKGALLLGSFEAPDCHLVLYEDAYPALVRACPALSEHHDVGPWVVHGELYRVTEEHLERLDEFEECPHLYQRQRVRLRGGEVAETYCIEVGLATTYPVIRGDYRAHVEGRR